MLKRRNNDQQPPVKALEPLKRRKSGNNEELGVVFPKEGNSNNPELIQDDVKVVPPSQEIEDNPDTNHEQEGAEPSVTRDLTPALLDSGVGGGRGPPATG